MINNITLNKLEYNKVLLYISNYTSTEQGKEEILNLKPFSSLKYAEQQGKLVSEAKEILINYEYPPINYLPNLQTPLTQSKIKGSILKINSIRQILDLAQISRKLFSFLKSNNNGELFNTYSGQFFINKNFELHINKVFNEAGEIRDSASKKLNKIRKEIIIQNGRLKNVINNILKGLSNSYLVQEDYITQRDGRLVLPIKAEHKRHVKGFIHSESSTGQTVYIEPEQTLELNNEILTLTFAEKREIERILKELTILIGEHSNDLIKALNVITKLDVIFANAKYSLEIIGAFPIFNKNGQIKILDARHPILLKKLGRDNTVPLDFHYDDKNKVTLITGPNAGGKTVVLKTIGLISALVQSGIHVPIDPDSELIFFNKIMLDIGDEQSIEEDLSTFSSHLSNIKEILDEADESSLILIDEIGTGTDPSEGTALAASFLIKMMEKNSIVIATTHHGNLKIIASELKGFQNASMEYDLKNLKPTYRFRQGIPGSSYAFEVAGKIGLDKNILEVAEKYLDSDKNIVEKFIIELENKSLELTKKLNRLEIENSRLEGLTNLYERENANLKKQKNQILQATKAEAEKFLSNVNSQFENTIKRIKETNAEKKVIVEEKKKLDILKENIDINFKSAEETETNEDEFKVNSFVKIKDSFTTGDIVEIDYDKKTATIATGSLRIKVKLKNLIPAKKVKEKPEDEFISIPNSLGSTQLDIRGRKPEEVEFEIVKFIDDAYLSNLKSVEIVHGKGTGVLRETVHNLLKAHEMVKSFDFASVELGGAGATIVKLKE